MKSLFFKSMACVLMSSVILSCSESNEVLEQEPSHFFKDGKGIWGKIKSALKATVKLEVQFGTNTPNPNGITNQCVNRSICWIRAEGSFGIHPGEAGINAIAERSDDGNLILAFDKSDMSAPYMAFHFENNQFVVTDPLVFPNIGILNSDLDFPISPGSYSVIYEDEEIIAIEIQ